MESFAMDLEGVKAWCGRQNLKFLENAAAGQLLIPRGEKDAPIRFIARPERQMSTLAVVLPFQAPADRRAEVAQACNALNSSSFMGAWVMNNQSGEIYFRLTLPTGGATFTDEGLMFLVRVLIGTADAVVQPMFRVAVEGQPFTAALPAPTT